jgi:hypothetical protein
LNPLLSRLKLPKLHNTGCMVAEIFESLFWVGPGFIPKSHLVESSSSNRNNINEEKEVKETENRSIKSETIIILRHLLGLRNKEKK